MAVENVGEVLRLLGSVDADAPASLVGVKICAAFISASLASLASLNSLRQVLISLSERLSGSNFSWGDMRRTEYFWKHRVGSESMLLVTGTLPHGSVWESFQA